MKSFWRGSALFFVITAVAGMAQAQESSAVPEPLPENPSSDSAGLTEPLPLIPEDQPTVAKPTTGGNITVPEREEKDRKGQTAAQRMNTSGTSEALALKVRFREAKTRALQDPKVQAALDEAARAPTDFERRQAMFRYFNLMFALIEKRDSSLKPLILARHTTAAGRLKETRIEPTHAPLGYEGPIEQVSAGPRKKGS